MLPPLANGKRSLIRESLDSPWLGKPEALIKESRVAGDFNSK
jgi:hypothetical protein